MENKLKAERWDLNSEPGAKDESQEIRLKKPAASPSLQNKSQQTEEFWSHFRES
jgi:hypothetical protein